ncbi:MAG: hypothetical protein Fur0010_22060 [Bdellovibrio sp.]
MSPLLMAGDQLVVETDYSQLHFGQIIVFKDSETHEFVAHRIVQKFPLMTKGDFSIIDERVDEIHIMGLVVGRIRNGQTLIWGNKPNWRDQAIALISRNYHQQFGRWYRGFFKLILKVI